MYCKSYFIASCNSSCSDMHLFMDPRLQWEWNTAVGGIFNEISRQTHIHTCAYSHTHPHIHTNTLTLTHTHTHVHKHTDTLSLFCGLFLIISFPYYFPLLNLPVHPSSFVISSNTLIFTPSFPLNSNSVRSWYLHIRHKQWSYLYYSKQPSFVIV